MEIPSSLRHLPEDNKAARMAARKVKKICNLSLLESSIPHTKTGKNLRPRVEKKFVRLKYLINMQKG
jgi:hypothetical protein